jgi:hypothetical protein
LAGKQVEHRAPMAVDFHAHTKQKATNFLVAFCTMAEPVGFEPTVGSTPTQLFESCTFGRSDTVP